MEGPFIRETLVIDKNNMKRFLVFKGATQM